jgi:hypothetical protein
VVALWRNSSALAISFDMATTKPMEIGISEVTIKLTKSTMLIAIRL